MSESNIYRAYNFVLDLGGGVVCYFTRVSGMSVDIETIDYREGGGAPAVRKLAGRVSYKDIELQWGLSESMQLWEWLMSAASGRVERKNVSIILRDTDGVTELTRWNINNAFPRGWCGCELNAMGNEVAIETLFLCHEGLERA